MRQRWAVALTGGCWPVRRWWRSSASPTGRTQTWRSAWCGSASLAAKVCWKQTKYVPFRHFLSEIWKTKQNGVPKRRSNRPPEHRAPLSTRQPIKSVHQKSVDQSPQQQQNQKKTKQIEKGTTRDVAAKIKSDVRPIKEAGPDRRGTWPISGSRYRPQQ